MARFTRERLTGGVFHRVSSYDDVPLAEVLAVERLSFLEPEGKVDYRYGQDACDHTVRRWIIWSSSPW